MRRGGLALLALALVAALAWWLRGSDGSVNARAIDRERPGPAPAPAPLLAGDTRPPSESAPPLSDAASNHWPEALHFVLQGTEVPVSRVLVRATQGNVQGVVADSEGRLLLTDELRSHFSDGVTAGTHGYEPRAFGLIDRSPHQTVELARRAPFVRIAGTVVAERGDPVGGIIVGIDRRDTGTYEILYRTTTGEDGAFAFEMPPGHGEILAGGPGWLMTRQHLVSGETLDERIVLRRDPHAAAVHLTILRTDGSPASGARGHDSGPQASLGKEDATAMERAMRLTHRLNPSLKVTNTLAHFRAGSDGTALLAHRAPGRHMVRVGADGEWAEATYAVPSPASDQHVVVRLEPGRVLRGSVRLSRDPLWRCAHAEHPVSIWAMTWTMEDGQQTILRLEEPGSFETMPLPSTKGFSLVFSVPGHPDRTVVVPESKPTRGAVLDLSDVVLPDAREVQIVVHDAEREPAARVIVVVHGRYADTGDDGRATVRIRSDGEGAATGRIPVLLRHGNVQHEVTVDFTLPEPIEIHLPAAR